MSISHPLAGTAVAAGDSRLALRCAVEALADEQLIEELDSELEAVRQAYEAVE